MSTHPSEMLKRLAQEAALEVDSSAFAEHMDANDPLKKYREEFHFPDADEGSDNSKKVVYFCGNSLGLQHKDVEAALMQEVKKWRTQAVEGHFRQPNPWFEIDDILREDMGKIIGGSFDETVIMNGLTSNLHLLLAAFYNPVKDGRYKLMHEKFPFPSDMHAFVSQVENHGFAADDALVEVYDPSNPRAHESPAYIPTEAWLKAIEEHGDKTAVIVLGAVHFLTGQFFDIGAITKAAHAKGIIVGVDAAHAVGNVPLHFHDWGVDFACWCTYKYLNGGPGNIAGAFVHDKWHEIIADNKPKMGRQLKGWWGHERKNRFALHKKFDYSVGAAAFQLSNPPVMAMMSLAPSLRLCAKIGVQQLRQKSLLLTGFLELLLQRHLSHAVEIVTPANVDERGAQLSVRLLPGKVKADEKKPAGESYACGTDLGNDSDRVARMLEARSISCDNRPPDIVRLAPVPTYNSFSDVWTLVDALRDMIAAP